jgi:hypothetical protein
MVTDRLEIEQLNSRLIARMMERGSLMNNVARHTVRREFNGFGGGRKVNVDTKQVRDFGIRMRLRVAVLLGFKVGQRKVSTPLTIG